MINLHKKFSFRRLVLALMIGLVLVAPNVSWAASSSCKGTKQEAEDQCKEKAKEEAKEEFENSDQGKATNQKCQKQAEGKSDSQICGIMPSPYCIEGEAEWEEEPKCEKKGVFNPTFSFGKVKNSCKAARSELDRALEAERKAQDKYGEALEAHERKKNSPAVKKAQEEADAFTAEADESAIKAKTARDKAGKKQDAKAKELRNRADTARNKAGKKQEEQALNLLSKAQNKEKEARGKYASRAEAAEKNEEQAKDKYDNALSSDPKVSQAAKDLTDASNKAAKATQDLKQLNKTDAGYEEAVQRENSAISKIVDARSALGEATNNSLKTNSSVKNAKKDVDRASEAAKKIIDAQDAAGEAAAKPYKDAANKANRAAQDAKEKAAKPYEDAADKAEQAAKTAKDRASKVFDDAEKKARGEAENAQKKADQLSGKSDLDKAKSELDEARNRTEKAREAFDSGISCSAEVTGGKCEFSGSWTEGKIKCKKGGPVKEPKEPEGKLKQPERIIGRKLEFKKETLETDRVFRFADQQYPLPTGARYSIYDPRVTIEQSPNALPQLAPLKLPDAFLPTPTQPSTAGVPTGPVTETQPTVGQSQILFTPPLTSPIRPIGPTVPSIGVPRIGGGGLLR